jgi:lipoate-protein ligase A
MSEVAEPTSVPKLRWRVLIDAQGRPGAENMALDQQLLEEVEHRSDSVAYLRLYRWSPPCLSFGRNERARTRYDRQRIEALAIPVVRRPTGGRAVWHHQEVTYSVAAPVAPFGSLGASYRAVHCRLLRGLRQLGVAATLALGPERGARFEIGPCFGAAVGGEIVVGGEKLVGSAQIRTRRAFLQHGSILLAGNQEPVLSVTRGAKPAVRITTLARTLNRDIGFEEVVEALLANWTRAGEELEKVSGLAIDPARLAWFSDPAWTWRR